MSTFARAACAANHTSHARIVAVSIERNIVVEKTTQMDSGTMEKRGSGMRILEEQEGLSGRDGVKKLIKEMVRRKREEEVRREKQAGCCDGEAGKKGRECDCVEMVEYKK